jgi:hypothetical protein
MRETGDIRTEHRIGVMSKAGFKANRAKEGHLGRDVIYLAG